MRLVLDTNVVVSGLLWSGPPARLLRTCLAEGVELFTCTSLLEELQSTLERPKLQPQVSASELTPQQIVHLYSRNAVILTPEKTPRVCRDPDDDVLLAVALAAQADLVSGDKDLLTLGAHMSVKILSVSAALDNLRPR